MTDGQAFAGSCWIAREVSETGSSTAIYFSYRACGPGSITNPGRCIENRGRFHLLGTRFGF